MGKEPTSSSNCQEGDPQISNLQTLPKSNLDQEFSRNSRPKIEIEEISKTVIFEGRSFSFLDHNLKEIIFPYIKTTPTKQKKPSFGAHMHVLAPIGFALTAFVDKSNIPPEVFALLLLGIGLLSGVIVLYLFEKWRKYFREKENYEQFGQRDIWKEIITELEKRGKDSLH